MSLICFFVIFLVIFLDRKFFDGKYSLYISTFLYFISILLVSTYEVSLPSVINVKKFDMFSGFILLGLWLGYGLYNNLKHKINNSNYIIPLALTFLQISYFEFKALVVALCVSIFCIKIKKGELLVKSYCVLIFVFLVVLTQKIMFSEVFLFFVLTLLLILYYFEKTNKIDFLITIFFLSIVNNIYGNNNLYMVTMISIIILSVGMFLNNEHNKFLSKNLEKIFILERIKIKLNYLVSKNLKFNKIYIEQKPLEVSSRQKENYFYLDFVQSTFIAVILVFLGIIVG